MEISSISVDGLRKVNLVFTLAKIILNRYFLLLNVKKMALKLNITFKNIQTKQNSKVTYLGSILDEKISGEPLTLKVIMKLTQDFIYCLKRKHRF